MPRSYFTRVSILVLASLAAAFWATDSRAGSDDGPPAWVPPKASKWDWVHLTSGEWLKGEIKSLRDRKLLFDSDNLDDIELDWVDVDALYLRRPHFFRLESGENVQGTGELRAETLYLDQPDGMVREIPRSEIFGIIPGGGRELEFWSAYTSVGFTLREGNTDQVDLSGTAGFGRESPTVRWKNTYRGAYGRLDGDKTAENHRANTAVDVFLTSRLFLTVPFVEYFRDDFQNLEHRVAPGIAIGYEFVRNSWAEWDVSLGPAYEYTVFTESEPGEDDFSHDMAAVLITNFDLDLPRGTEIDSLYRVSVVTTNVDQTSHHFETTISFDLWGPLDLDVTFTLDRIERPEPDSDGDRPNSNDYRTIVALALDF